MLFYCIFVFRLTSCYANFIDLITVIIIIIIIIIAIISVRRVEVLSD